MSSSLSPSELVRSSATPGLFAASITRGRHSGWSMFRHHALLDRKLVDLALGKTKRLIVEMPPRHGKSELCSRYFPAWYLGTFPSRNVILTSATDDLAEEFSVKSRDLLVEFGPSYFGVRVRNDMRARKSWRLETGGGVLAAGVGGSIIGKGGNLVIVDDYLRNSEEALSEVSRRKVHQWFLSTAQTRLAPDGVVLVIATRWHGDDLIGRLLKAEPEKWEVVRFPAIAEEADELGRLPGEALWPEWFPLEKLLEIKRSYEESGYGWLWDALYQQNPPETLDAEFDPAYFRGEDLWFDDWPGDVGLRVMALDPSKGKTDRSDYSAFVMVGLGRNGVMFVDADLARRDTTRIVADGLELGRSFNPHAFGCETNAFQELLADEFKRQSCAAGAMLPLWYINNYLAKESRIRLLTPYLAQRKFRFRRSPGSRLLVEQLRGWPSCRYDDGPDALSMAVGLLNQVRVGAGVQDEVVVERAYA